MPETIKHDDPVDRPQAELQTHVGARNLGNHRVIAAQQLVGGAPEVRVSNEPHRALAEGGPIAVDNVVGSSGPRIV